MQLMSLNYHSLSKVASAGTVYLVHNSTDINLEEKHNKKHDLFCNFFYVLEKNGITKKIRHRRHN